MCASAATSSRRSPGVRRRRPGPRPDVLGLQCLTAVAEEICLWLGSHSLPALGFCLGLDCSGPSIDCQSGLLVLRSITSLPSLDEDRRQRPCRPRSSSNEGALSV